MAAIGRRRGAISWFVEPYLQVKLGLMFLVVNFIFAGAIGFIFWFYLWDVYNAVSVYFNLTGGQNNEILEKMSQPLFIGSGLIFAFIVTTIMVSARYTHRIYGPLVSIHRFLDDIINNQPAKPLLLRESDQLKDLASKLNQIAQLHIDDQRLIALKAIHRWLDEELAGQSQGPLKLREGDAFVDMAEKLNRLAVRSASDHIKKAN